MPNHAGAQRTLDLGDVQVPFTVRVSPRARYVRLSASSERGLVLALPRGVGLAEGEAFMRCKQSWVRQQIGAIERRRREKAEQRPIPDHLPLWGTNHPLRFETVPPMIAVEVPAVGVSLQVAHMSGIRPALRGWLQVRARREIPLRAQVLAEKHFAGPVPGRIQVRDQRSRWGSCSARGTISLNWRLVMMPRDVADYVILHELTHVRHPHHGPAFWRELACVCPDCQNRKDWLKDNGRDVMDY